MKITARTMAIEWSRRAMKKYESFFKSNNISLDEILEIAYFAGYTSAQHTYGKKLKELSKTTKRQ